MSNTGVSLRPIKFEEVTTTAEANKLIAQECVDPALQLSSTVFIVGTLAYTYMVQMSKLYRRIPIMDEYKLLIGVIPVISFSFYLAVHRRRKCEKELKEKLRAMQIDI